MNPITLATIAAAAAVLEDKLQCFALKSDATGQALAAQIDPAEVHPSEVAAYLELRHALKGERPAAAGARAR